MIASRRSEAAGARPDAPAGSGLWQYFVLTYAISWLAWWAMAIFRIRGGSVSPDQPAPSTVGLLLLALGGFAPSIVGVLMTWRVAGRAGLRDLWRRCVRFGLGTRACLVIFLVPALIAVVRVAVQLLRGGNAAVPGPLARPALLLVFTLQLVVFGAISEELGWRGFALPRLVARRGGLSAGLALGAIHALWHLPLFFVPGTIQQAWGQPAFNFALFALGTIGGALVFTWLHMATGGSVWAAVLFHLTSNFGTSMTWMSFDGGRLDKLVVALVSLATAAAVVGLSADRWRRTEG